MPSFGKCVILGDKQPMARLVCIMITSFKRDSKFAKKASCLMTTQINYSYKEIWYSIYVEACTNETQFFDESIITTNSIVVWWIEAIFAVDLQKFWNFTCGMWRHSDVRHWGHLLPFMVISRKETFHSAIRLQPQLNKTRKRSKFVLTRV